MFLLGLNAVFCRVFALDGLTLKKNLLALLLALGAAHAIRAQEDVHWAYAAHFGTGHYSLDGGGDTTVIGVAPGWLWREPSVRESGRYSPGFRLRLPIAVGAHEFADFDQLGGFRRDSINTLIVTPGVEVGFVRSERWRVKALGFAGLGTESNSNVDAKIFRLGFRSELGFELSDTSMFLVNGIERFGFSADNDVSDAINLVSTGLEFRRPLANKRLGGIPLALHWHVMYTNYLDTLGLDVARVSLDPATIGSEWELGVAFSKQNKRLELWRLKLDRLGLVLHYSGDNSFAGVGVSFRSLFDR